MKDKRILIAIVVVVLLIVGGGGYFVLAGRSQKTQEPEQQIEEVAQLDANEIGLKLEVAADKKNVKLVIEKTDGIKHIAYDITYDADSRDKEGQSEGVKVPRGFSDEKDLEGGPYESKEYFLGTCSSGTCIADKGVTSVKADVKVTKSDGKVYQSTASADL